MLIGHDFGSAKRTVLLYGTLKGFEPRCDINRHGREVEKNLVLWGLSKSRKVRSGFRTRCASE
ncbi:hypothetical protein OHAE_2389 [Ochrobactrum soli]|uniref:Uncharacterized protein n=1 Tax=Ochrobactrum soli TaxID=2448455 RepID=A0A2P9HR42_9HYPH|nr:hypothetical protein OHAE_2389 [[Ochrobactrum] soli]